MDQILELCSKYIDSGKFVFLILGVIGFFLKIIAKFIQKKFDELEKLKNEVKTIANKVEIFDLKSEGRNGFIPTLQDHEIRISVVEKIIDRRRDIIPIKFEDRRRKN